MTDKERRGFHQQAARASWMAPIVAFFLMAATNSTIRSSQSPLAGLIIGGTYILLLFAGIGFGITACFGGKRHGAKTTVIQGVLGALLSVSVLGIIIAIAVPNFIRTRDATRTARTQALQRMVNDANSQLPVMADDETRIDKITVLGHDALEYQFTFVHTYHNEFDIPQFNSESRAQIVEQYRTSDDFKMYRDNRITVRFTYLDMVGQLITSIDVGPDDAM